MPSKPLKRPLTPQQETFAAEYLKDSNATQAALRAGYKPKAAYAQGAHLLKHPQVKAIIEKAKAEALAKATKKFSVSKERIIQELRAMAFTDITDYADISEEEIFKTGKGASLVRKTVNFKESKDWKPGAGRAVKKLGMGPKGIVMEFYDKKGSLELLAKLGGHVEDTIKHKGDPNAPLGDSVQVLITMPDNGRDKKKADQ